MVITSSIFSSWKPNAIWKSRSKGHCEWSCHKKQRICLERMLSHSAGDLWELHLSVLLFYNSTWQNGFGPDLVHTATLFFRPHTVWHDGTWSAQMWLRPRVVLRILDDVVCLCITSVLIWRVYTGWRWRISLHRGREPQPSTAESLLFWEYTQIVLSICVIWIALM